MESEKKITLPKQLQIEMMKFFLRTSIPRKKIQEQEKQEQEQQANSLSKK